MIVWFYCYMCSLCSILLLKRSNRKVWLIRKTWTGIALEQISVHVPTFHLITCTLWILSKTRKIAKRSSNRRRRSTLNILCTNLKIKICLVTFICNLFMWLLQLQINLIWWICSIVPINYIYHTIDGPKRSNCILAGDIFLEIITKWMITIQTKCTKRKKIKKLPGCINNFFYQILLLYALCVCTYLDFLNPN